MRFLVISLFAFSAHAGQVIDLGKVNVEGAARGPEIQLIGEDAVAKRALQRAVLNEIKGTEDALLNELSGKSNGGKR